MRTAQLAVEIGSVPREITYVMGVIFGAMALLEPKQALAGQTRHGVKFCRLAKVFSDYPIYALLLDFLNGRKS